MPDSKRPPSRSRAGATGRSPQKVPLPAEPEWLDHPDDIADFAADLADAPWICMDTEFLREKTYWPQLCLLQVAAPDLLACIDPLDLPKAALDPLWDQLSLPGRTVVMHAARQDLELMDHVSERLPDQLFDSQVAATLLGIGDQMGYAALVEKLLGIHVPKGQSRTDWTRRPLSEQAIRYAADDVRHLAQIYPMLRQQLDERDRLDWLWDACDAMLDPSAWRIDPDAAWQRVKGAKKLKGQQAAVARVIAAWREQAAEEADRPRKWLLSDDAIIDLARVQPSTQDELSRMRSLKGGAKGAPLLDLIRTGLRTPEPEQAPKAPRLKLEADHAAVTDTLAAIVRWIGLQEGVSPGSLANRADLESIAAGRPVAEVLSDWRVGLLAGPLEGFLSGRLSLHMEKGLLSLDKPMGGGGRGADPIPSDDEPHPHKTVLPRSREAGSKGTRSKDSGKRRRPHKH